MELPNQGKIRTVREKETNKYLGILEADTIKQVEMEKKLGVSQENQKVTRHKTIWHGPYQRKKIPGLFPS